MKGQEPVRIGLVGLDHWYNAIGLAEAAAKSTRAELVAIVDEDADRAGDLAQRLGVKVVGTNPRLVIEDDSIDAVMSFGTVPGNVSVCLSAATSGKHVFAGKPLARDLEAASEVVTAVRKTNVVFFPGDSRFRSISGFEELHRVVTSGRLGRPLSAHLWVWAPLPRSWPSSSDPGWFADPELVPGGAWIDHGIYQIDLVRWLFSDEIIEIRGETANLKHKSLKVEDFGIATAHLSRGAVVSLEDSWTAPAGIFRLGIHLLGEDGVATFDSQTDQLLVNDSEAGPGNWRKIDLPERDEAETDLDRFVSAIKGDMALATVIDAYKNLAAGLAFYEAARSGEPVSC
ncbi:MAG: Gfo/Idh/MocA family oxidoreductase [Acidimicrobiales bacterium]